MLDFLILALAAWRVTSLLVEEDGPFYILERLRFKLGMRYDENSRRVATNEIARGFECVWCLSVWVGGLMAVLYWIAPRAALMLAFPFALSAAAIMVEEFVNGNR